MFPSFVMSLKQCPIQKKVTYYTHFTEELLSHKLHTERETLPQTPTQPRDKLDPISQRADTIPRHLRYTVKPSLTPRTFIPNKDALHPTNTGL